MVKGRVGRHEFNVAYKDMDVEMPILSVRKMVKRQNDVRFTNNGGSITHRRTKRVIPFYEFEGVYFVKVKVGKPGEASDPMAVDAVDVADFMEVDPVSPFHRPE